MFAPSRRPSRRLLTVTAALGVATVLAACGSGNDTAGQSTATSTGNTGSTTLATSSSAASSAASPHSGSTGGSASQSPADSSFPVTIKSALGDAVIKTKPVRMATWGWSSQDAVLALGIVPVAMPAYPYGGVDGVLPWDTEAIKTLGGTAPTLLKGSESGDPLVEEFVAAKPDVILAPYSGLTQEQFDALSKVAPVVAYPDQRWSTSWQDQALIIGKALGQQAQAEKLIEQTNTKVADLATKYPELKDKTFVYGANNEPEVFNIYRQTDPRVQLLVQLGMKVAPSVDANDPKPQDSSYFYRAELREAAEGRVRCAGGVFRQAGGGRRLPGRSAGGGDAAGEAEAVRADRRRVVRDGLQRPHGAVDPVDARPVRPEACRSGQE